MKCIFTLLLLFIGCCCRAQDGNPDPNFGTNGLVVNNLVGQVNKFNRQEVVVLPNLQILQAFAVDNGTNFDFGLTRYLEDGSIDTDFGPDGDGNVTANFGANDVANSMAVQSNGRIVLAGYSDNGTASAFALARFLPDGSLDPDFGGGDGLVTTLIGDSSGAFAVAIQNDGGIVVAGYSKPVANGAEVFTVARYLANGTLDPSFGGGDGIVTTPIDGAGSDRAHSLALQRDGRIVVAGYSTNPADPANQSFAVVRYLTDGTPDPSFSGDGIVVTAVGTSVPTLDVPNAVAIDRNDRIVVAGFSNNANQDFAIVRYTPTGSLDVTFDTDGRLFTDLGRAANDVAFDLLIQEDNKIVLAGNSNAGPGTADFAVSRFNEDGTPDRPFGDNNTGTVFIDFGGDDDYAYSIASQATNLIVGGATVNSLGLVRLLNSSTALPLHLLTFTATRGADGVLLRWETEGEQQTAAFELQRSSTGSHFTTIRTVKAGGNSSAPKAYAATDHQPLQPMGYYRLKMVDLDGTFSYSRVVAVRHDAQLTVQAFPNPVKSALTLQFTAPRGPVRVQLADATGRLVTSLQLQSGGSTVVLPVDMSRLQRGLYFITVNGSSIAVVKE